MPDIQPGPFDVSAEQLAQVSPALAVNIVRQLLIAEAQQIGIPVTAVNVPSTIYIADGGVDAEVSLVEADPMPLGLLRSGHARYQIKSGGFSATNDTELKTLIFRPWKRGAAYELNHRVKECLEKNGTFIVLLFGAEATGTHDGYGVTELKTLLTEAGYPDAKVEILRANQIGSAIKALSPSLALQINGIISPDGAPLYTLEHLEKSCGLEVARYVGTDARANSIRSIMELANDLTGFRHVRVVGDPGTGKTHLTYAAVESSLSKDLVLYCDFPDKMIASPLIGRLTQAAKSARIILIADDCDLSTALSLEERLKNIASHFLLVTIFSQSAKDTMLDADLVDVESLEAAAMQAIFAGYGIPEEGQTWLADLCQGSPRAAHSIGKLVSRNPEVDYADHFPRLDQLWVNVVASPDSPISAEGRDKLTVAKCIAIFKRVAWGPAHGDSGRQQLDKVIALVSSLDAATVSNIISALQDGRILQGNTTLFITPKLLHIKLWCDWWDDFEHLVTDEWLKDAFEGKMREWFNEMFEYARESKAAGRVVMRMLANDGQFSRLEYFSKPGQAQLFFALAQAEPKAALRRLKAALGVATKAELENFKQGRREVVHGLERMAIPEQNFLDAAECLLLLADEENETWSNNASGVFVSLFTLGYGKLAASAFSPIDKIPYLRTLIQSAEAGRRRLAIRALAESLHAFMSRTNVGDTVGLRQLPDRWMPATYGELWNAYLAHINLLAEAIPLVDGEEKHQAAMGIIGNARSLVSIPTVAPRVLELLRIYGSMPELKTAVTETIESSLHYDSDGLETDVVAALEALRIDLTERTFHDKLVRYAGLQLTEDSFDQEGTYRGGPHPALIALAEEVMHELTLVEPELQWLLTEQAKNGFAFGALLGSGDGLRLWPSIRSAWLAMDAKIRTNFFISGYLSGTFERAPNEWQHEILSLIAVPGLAEETLSIVWRSGMTDDVAQALLEACRAGNFQTRAFGILTYGARVKDLPLVVFAEIMQRLIASEESLDAECALNLLQSRRRVSQNEASALIGLLQETLNHSAFITGGPSHHRPNNMRDYYWTNGAEELLEVCPTEALKLAVRCIENFGADGSVTEGFYSETLKFFDALLVQFPNEIWSAAASTLDDEFSDRTYRITRWLRGRRNEGGLEKSSGFELIDADIVMRWVDEAPDTRAALIAHFCPPVISRPGEPASLARLLIERYGSIYRVNGSLHSNFMTAFWSGPASQYYQGRLDSVRGLHSIETNANVRRWLANEIDCLEGVVEQEKAREEERGY